MGRYRKPLEAVLVYKHHSVSPEDFLHFIELKQFTSAWEDLGLNDEDDLTALQIIIMANPSDAPIIQGTGGLRKLRFTSPESQAGKSGAFRVCYIYFEEYSIVVLALIYSKNEKDNLTADEKKTIRVLIAEIEKELEKLNSSN
jgi:hypothetical protein